MIFVTGATGFVGRTLLQRLLERNEAIRCLVRNPSRRILLEHPHLTWVDGDLLQPERLQSAFEGIDTVIHLVGILIETREGTFDRIHRQGTEAMVKMASKAGIRRYLQMSALGTRPNARSRYHQTKWAAEEAIRSSGISYTIFRPSIIFGAEDKFINLFSKIIKLSPVLPIIGTGNNRMQPIWVENVVDYFIQALGRPDTEMKTYEIGGPRIYSMEELMNLVMKIRRKRRLKIHFPVSALRLQAAMMEYLLPRSPLTRDQLLMLEEDNVVTDLTALRDFSVKLAFPEEVLSYYL
jgi:uncharacterized protein YbjT (DUF2867 family)